MTSRRAPTWLRRREDAAGTALVRLLAAAMAAEDRQRIRALLTSDVGLVADGGPTGVGGELSGPDAVSAELLGYPSELAVLRINGMPGLVARSHGRVTAVVCAQTRRGRIAMLWSVRNPQKLRHWDR